MDCHHVEIILDRVARAGFMRPPEVARIITNTLAELDYDLPVTPSLDEMKELLLKASLAAAPPSARSRPGSVDRLNVGH